MFVFVSGFLFQTTALKGGAGIFFAKVGNVNFGVECGTVDSAVACNSRGPGFEFSHWQLLLNNYLLANVC